MDVFFVPQKGEPFAVEVGFFDTVLEIKEKIQKYHHIPIPKQTLVFNGRVLQDDCDVEFCEILQNSHIQLVVASEPENSTIAKIENSSPDSPPKKIHLTIKIPANQSHFPIEIDVNDSIRRLKERIHEMEVLIPVNKLVLQSNGGAELEDHCSLLHYELSDNSEIEVSLRPSPSPTASAAAATCITTTNTIATSKKLKVMVKTQCGNQKIPMEVNASDNVSELKKELKKQEQKLQINLPKEGFFFIHDQQVMEEDRSFRWHRVSQGAIIEIFNGSVSGG